VIKQHLKSILRRYGFIKIDDNLKYKIITEQLNDSYKNNYFSLLIKDRFGIISEREDGENWRHLLQYRVSNDANDWMEAFQDMIPRGELAVDVGAAIGITSVYFSRLFTNVHAYEPIEENQIRFKTNVALNCAKNIQLNSLALSNVSGDGYMNKYESFGHHSLGEVFESRHTKAKVQISTLDVEYFQKSNIDLLKLDIEGFEFEALAGAKNLLSNNLINCIIIENSPQILKRRGIKSNDIFDLITHHGFAVYDISRNRISSFSDEQGDFICLKK